MGIKIKHAELFKEKLRSGINVFTGAGFSCLPNASGYSLPTAKELCTEICSAFSLPDEFSDDLEALSALAPKQQLQDLLRKKFTIIEYNDSYDVLNKINMLSYITTNIDNIIHQVTDNSRRYFLKSITYYGSTKNANNELTYIPLHGDVTNPNSLLYFGKFDLANVDKANTDLFKLMHSKLLERPTIFWGYGFHDSGVLKTISKLLEFSPHDVWVQCLPSNTKGISLFKAKGCNIIEANTQELFDWIDAELDELPRDNAALVEKKELKPYFIPTINQVEAIQVDEYYQKGNTHWHPILANGSYELPIVNDLYELALRNKNVILTGGKFTGKTTILMQLALKVESTNKLFVEKLTPENARFIVSQIGNTETWLFYHDCAEDIESFTVFARTPNFRVIGIAEEYLFESTRHLLEGISYKLCEIDELKEQQAQLLFERIPPFIRMNNKLKYKELPSEKFSMLEMISKNVREVQTKDIVWKMLTHLYKHDLKAFDAVSLATYLSNNGSALSIDIMFPYFSINSYEEANAIIMQAKNLLNQFNFELNKDEIDQDYFILRSKLFALHANKILVSDRLLKQRYSEVIKRFTLDVSPYRIFRYDIFQRRAHDSDLFYNLFGNRANEIYNYLYEYDNNPYTLQQWALCRLKLGEYHQAFIDIDKALGQRPYNFSMKNSRAIILFEANKNQGTPLAVEKMKEAMDILRLCYNNDKRKSYHAQKYAEFAIVLADQHSVREYLDEAMKWIIEIMERRDSNTRKTKNLRYELGKRL